MSRRDLEVQGVRSTRAKDNLVQILAYMLSNLGWSEDALVAEIGHAIKVAEGRVAQAGEQ